MADNKTEKWAANIAFVGDKEKIKEIVKIIENLEEEGHIQEFNMIEGPHDSLRDMLKRRKVELGISQAHLISASKNVATPSVEHLPEEKKEEDQDE